MIFDTNPKFESTSVMPFAATPSASENKRSLKWISTQARELATLGPAKGKSWTLSEVCEHIALAIESTVRFSGDELVLHDGLAPGHFARVKQSLIRWLMLTTGWFPRNVPAPSFVAPSGLLTLDESIELLDRAIDAFDLKYKSTASTWCNHHILGKMSGWSWRRFHAIHAAHHFSYFINSDRTD